MYNLYTNQETNEPSLAWFINEISQPEHSFRQRNVKTIINHLHRRHSVLERLKHTYTFKNGKFTPAAIILQGLKTVLNFHVAYLVGNPVSITGTEKAVEQFNNIYRKGIYSKVDWKILYDLMEFGDAFEYVYFDAKSNSIKSKVFRNGDSYPIYNEYGEYAYFVEYWKDRRGDKHYTIYFPDHIDTYTNYRLVDSKPNATGLPIHYVGMERAIYDQFGDSLVLDLIPIMDKIEHLLSKEDDAVTTLSLNPILSIQGQKVGEKEMQDSNIAGSVLHLDDGQKAEWVNAEMDYNVIKHELDNLYQQFNMVACIPAGAIGQSNIANVSESTTNIIYQLTENRGKQNMNALIDGFKQRWQYMRLLSDPISDDDFESLNVVFNINKPVDTKNNMENMQIQYQMGAISKKTVMEQSPYTTDSAQEIQRLKEEQAESEEEETEQVNG